MKRSHDYCSTRSVAHGFVSLSFYITRLRLDNYPFWLELLAAGADLSDKIAPKFIEMRRVDLSYSTN